LEQPRHALGHDPMRGCDTMMAEVGA
jgi:hypothetical protein